MKVKFNYEVYDPKGCYSSRFAKNRKMANDILREMKSCNDPQYTEYWANYNFKIRRRIEIVF